MLVVTLLLGAVAGGVGFLRLQTSTSQPAASAAPSHAQAAQQPAPTPEVTTTTTSSTMAPEPSATPVPSSTVAPTTVETTAEPTTTAVPTTVPPKWPQTAAPIEFITVDDTISTEDGIGAPVEVTSRSVSNSCGGRNNPCYQGLEHYVYAMGFNSTPGAEGTSHVIGHAHWSDSTGRIPDTMTNLIDDPASDWRQEPVEGRNGVDPGVEIGDEARAYLEDGTIVVGHIIAWPEAAPGAAFPGQEETIRFVRKVDFQSRTHPAGHPVWAEFLQNSFPGESLTILSTSTCGDQCYDDCLGFYLNSCGNTAEYGGQGRQFNGFALVLWSHVEG